MGPREDRRKFLHQTGLAGLALVTPWLGDLQTQKESQKEEEISPAEDLMREHGLLNRVLLLYEEVNRRLRAKAEIDPEILASAAGIIQHFIEEYHEKLEEDHLFPRFEKAHKLTDLVKVLRDQHQAGRRLTAEIQRLAAPAPLKDAGQRQKLSRLLSFFVRMYRPHEAREDTVLFPALHAIVSANEYDSLGEDFEKKEHELFGEQGFEKMVDKVAGLERVLGIYELSRFTPH